MRLWGSEKMRWTIQIRKKSDYFIDFMGKEWDQRGKGAMLGLMFHHRKMETCRICCY